MRHTKIVATLGPASNSAETIESLIRAGVDVVRLNFSHGTQETHQLALGLVRSAAARVGREVSVLQDLSGPKIRTGSLEGGKPLALNPGDRLVIGVGDFPGRPGTVSTTYAPLAPALSVGDRLLLDDGTIELRVIGVAGDHIETQVIDGGTLGEHKGITAPNVVIPGDGLTTKDVADLQFGLAVGVDLVAISFVRSAKELERARSLTAAAGRPRVPLIAKLERPEAIEHLSEIVAASDAVMVARGDLGLEMPLEQVPQVQKQVLRLCRDHGVPVIVATQVLDSMRRETRPTRAEVSDAAGAVDAGADAIMLSGETAIGLHPVHVVEVLDRIIRNGEAAPPLWEAPRPASRDADHLPALCDAAVTLAARAGADAIVAVTREGRTARVLSARRPAAPVYAATRNDEVARRLGLWWGVTPIADRLADGADEIAARVIARLRAHHNLPTPATIVVVSANSDIARGDANFIRIRKFD